MNRSIRGMLLVGIAVVVFKLLKGGRQRHVVTRPDIVVSGGDALRVQTAEGDFVLKDDGWRHEHVGAPPQALQVTVSDTACNFDQNNYVEIYCVGKADPLVIALEVEQPGRQWHAYVRPPQGAAPSQPSPHQLVFWEDGGPVAIDRVEVGDTTCTAPVSVIVAQVP